MSTHRSEGAREDMQQTGAVRSLRWKEWPSAVRIMTHTCSTDIRRVGVGGGKPVGLEAGS